jgi:hypothetical protein
VSRLVFIFTRAATPVSAAIQAVDGGRWSHVAVLEADGTHVIEAVWPGGVRRRRLDSLLAARPDRLVLAIDVPDAAIGLAWAATVIGSGYDSGAILAFLLRRLFGAAPRLDDSGRYFCSEVGAGALRMSGLFLTPPDRRTSVRDLCEALLAAGAVVTALSGHA